MKRIRWTALLLLGLVLAAGLARYVYTPVHVLRVSDKRVITFPGMIDELRGIRIVFAGENHDQSQDHMAQLAIIKGLVQKGAPLAIGLEMFTVDSQEKLDLWTAGRLDEADFVKLYYREWGMPWPLYRDIFLYARKHRIPMVALNVPHEISRKVAKYGFASLTPEERKRLPQGITCNIDPVYRSFVRKAYALHSGGNDRSFEHFCEAQMLWNKGMGWYLQKYLVGNPGRTVVVLTGTGHAMKRAIPEEVFQGGRFSYRVILPEQPDLDRYAVTSQDADYLLLFGYFWWWG